MQKLLAAGCAVALLAGCMSDLSSVFPGDRPFAAAAARKGVPSYRFIRGMRRPALGQPAFLAEVANRWLPSMAARKGDLVAYLTAIPPGGEAGLPDEVALAAYESEAAHDRVWQSPAGAALTDLQGTLYDRASTTPERVQPLPAVLGTEGAFDALQQPTNWQGGVTTFFIGARQPAVPAGEFLERLSAQVHRERQAFGGQGLSGYVFMATPDYKLSFMQWPDLATFSRAMTSPEGQEVVAESRRLMRTVQFARVADFRGALAPGQVVSLPLPVGAAGP